MSDLSRTELEGAARKLGLELSEGQLKTLGRYAGMVRDWSRRMNLVSRKDTSRILSYHALDSLAASRFVPADSRVADVGTGAGLPGIPLAVARPDVEMLLVESSRKKCLFLAAVLGELKLNNARILEARAESLDPLECRVVLSRLTGSFKLVVKQVYHHLASRGTMVFFKTTDCRDELTLAAKTLARRGLSVARTEDIVLPISGVPRRFVVVAAS